MVRLAAAYPPDGLEYGRANPNNDEEGCDAVSLLSESSLDVREAVPRVSLERIYSADHLDEL